jgi:hypothetical protein
MSFDKKWKTTITTLAFFALSFFVFTLLVKFFGDFPTYPPINKNPLTWEEVLVRIDFIIFSSLITTFLFAYSLFLGQNKKGK